MQIQSFFGLKQIKMENNLTTTRRRIIELVKSQGFKVSYFFEEIGDSYANFKGAKLDIEPSADILVKIRTKIPNANIDWILTGEGEMLVDNSPTPNKKEDFFEKKLMEFFQRRDTQYQMILSQNSEIIRQNGEILKRVLEMQNKNK